MTVFQNKNLVKSFLEKKNQGRKNGGKFSFRQKKLRHRNRYRNLVLVSVADTETRLRSYTSLEITEIQDLPPPDASPL
jgi:ribosomal protein L2